jgi:L-ascorbate metabolism protein UlaG (beta-lactamase superfamily)
MPILEKIKPFTYIRFMNNLNPIKMKRLSFIILCLMLTSLLYGQNFQTDHFKTEAGELEITFVKHGSLMFQYNNKTIHVDPVMRMADYSKLPDADLILITHHHGDHFDLNAIHELNNEGTRIICTQKCLEISEEMPEATVMSDNESLEISSLKIQSVPAYNIKHKRENGEPFHPKGAGNGYVIDFAGKKVYVAGDTENIPEMADLEDIFIAFLPMNLPYTMTPEMTAEAARSFDPEILYPYHYGNTETSKLVELLKTTAIEVRIRDM